MKGIVEVGLDIGAKTFEATFQIPGKAVRREDCFDNTPEGHVRFLTKLLGYMGKSGSARVCLESTGVYSLDLALLLDRTDGIEAMVVNPLQMSKFREVIAERNKSDRTDADLALAFLQRMEFVRWQAPSEERTHLRWLARRIADLVNQQTQEKNRLHAAQASQDLPELVRRDLGEHLKELETRIKNLRREALKLLKDSEEMNRCYRLITTIKGIGDISAIQILSELLVLPRDLKVKQWVAWAGLDPVIYESGTSVHKAPRISKRGSVHLRHALFIPAMTAAIYEPHVKAFCEELKGRGRKPMQIYTAVMRKLLHSIFGMLKSNTPFDGAKFRALAA
jgi:transposase